MADEPTPGELRRHVDTVLGIFKEDVHSIAQRLDSKVDVQLLALQQQAQDERHHFLAEQVSALRREMEEKDRAAGARQEADEKRIQDYRRWLIGAIIVPAALVLLPLLLTRGKIL